MNRRIFLKKCGTLYAEAYAAGTLLGREHPAVAAESSGKVLKEKNILDGKIERKALEDSVRLACEWLVNIAQVKTEGLTAGKDENAPGHPYTYWKGAIRGEYRPARSYDEVKPGTWYFFCPIWHTGQAVKSLSLAYRYFGNSDFLESAIMGAEFIRHHQNRDKNSPDFGCILAYEDTHVFINTSAILECCDGLFHLSEVTGEEKYAAWAVDAIRWVVRKLYKGKGLFHDAYDPVKCKIINPEDWKNKQGISGRPLLDDGVLLLAWQRTKDNELRRVFYEVADRLLADEEPPGNWVNYVPCRWQIGKIHPRQAFWWGRPMWMAYKDSGKEKYRQCFDRACDWYVRAMQHDGGMIRNTYVDFSTDSFGHATSGVGTACIMFHDQYVQLGSRKYVQQHALGLKYMMSMQVRKATDPNMRGVIIEKVLPPGGTDAAPWHIRDLGTIMFVSSACLTLLNIHK